MTSLHSLLRYDEVIRCLGWRHNTTLYEPAVRPRMQQSLKYPLMTGEYEAINVPGLYFAGQLGHGKDHKRSAGGFIHGFRYTTRALSRILEAKYHSAPWASSSRISSGGSSSRKSEAGSDMSFPRLTSTPWDGAVGLGGPGCDAGALIADGPCLDPKAITSTYEGLIDHLFTRIDTGSGPYQMVAVLGDGITFKCPAGAAAEGNGNSGRQLDGEYYEEVPVEYFNQRFDALPRLVWHFGYAEQRRRLHETMEGGTLFQVQFWWYPGDCSAASPRSAPKKNHQDNREPRAKEMLRLGESISTRWGTQDQRVRIGQWLRDRLNAINLADVHGDHHGGGKAVRPVPGGFGMLPEYWTHPDIVADQQQEQEQLPLDSGQNDGIDSSKGLPDFKMTMGWGELPEVSTGWVGGAVDFNILNDGIWPLVLKEYNPPGCMKGAASKDVVQIKPGGAVRVVSHERNCWEATLDPSQPMPSSGGGGDDGGGGGDKQQAPSRKKQGQHRTQVLAQWTVDRADGLVQDVVVPFVLPNDPN